MELILVIALVTLISGQAKQQSPSQSPAEPSLHDEHAQMNRRGEQGMGFSQSATNHRFLLTSTGGVIQVEAKNAPDATDTAGIRMHLRHIAKAFQSGDFAIPMFVHDTVPPGVPEMKRLREHIRYSLEDTPTGGRVVISSTNKAALQAIHRFLRFQIEEHRTGDPPHVQ